MRVYLAIILIIVVVTIPSTICEGVGGAGNSKNSTGKGFSIIHLVVFIGFTTIFWCGFCILLFYAKRSRRREYQEEALEMKEEVLGNSLQLNRVDQGARQQPYEGSYTRYIYTGQFQLLSELLFQLLCQNNKCCEPKWFSTHYMLNFDGKGLVQGDRDGQTYIRGFYIIQNGKFQAKWIEAPEEVALDPETGNLDPTCLENVIRSSHSSFTICSLQGEVVAEQQLPDNISGEYTRGVWRGYIKIHKC